MKNELQGKRIAIELTNGDRLFGRVHKGTDTCIWIIEDSSKKPKDVPRDIITRALIVFEGVEDEEN